MALCEKKLWEENNFMYRIHNTAQSQQSQKICKMTFN